MNIHEAAVGATWQRQARDWTRPWTPPMMTQTHLTDS